MPTSLPFRIAGFDGLLSPPRGTGQAVMVLLHGYAMEPGELAPLARAMGLPATLYLPRGVEAALPTGRAWWPVDAGRRAAQLARGARDLHDEYPPGRDVLRARFAALLEELAQRHAGLPLVLAGFSQGGMLAADLVLHGVVRPRALALLSASCIATDEWAPRAPVAKGLPVLVAHGVDDDDLSVRAGERLRDLLAGAGARVSWLPFEGGHGIPLQVWRELRRFVTDAAIACSTSQSAGQGADTEEAAPYNSRPRIPVIGDDPP
jgi:phospholipase/carboxylesterase